MQKTKTKILTALLLSALTLTLIPLAFGSLGTIIIDSTSAIQPLPITPVPAGGNISLYFGNVTFSGSQFYLLFSQDGLSQVSSGDLRYTPIFNVAAVLDITTAPIVLADPNFPGKWIVGQGWINGTIPQNIPGGTFYIKAFDGATTALAVTQGIPVIGSLRIIPTSGAAGTPIIINGNAFPANSLVNLSYISLDPLGNIVKFANLTAANALGQFNYSMPAPDLRIAAATGDNAAVTNIIQFTAVDNATGATYTANYTEGQRGLLQFGRPRAGSIAGNLQNATGVYGNNTSFVATVTVGVGDTLRVVGNSFYPGVVTMRWDNSIDVAPTGATANDTGFFNATFAVPGTGLGPHNITMVDSGLQVFVVFVNVQQSITISPTSGPIGTTVTVNGFGYPANNVPAGNVYNVTITFSPAAGPVSTTVRAWSLTDAAGQFTATFNVPVAPGGANTVTATANDTALTNASKTFTVTALFTVTPDTFYSNSSSTAVAKGTGFDPAVAYFAAIDNQFSPFTNTTNGVMPNSAGNLSLTFVQAGFQPGVHVVSLYPVGAGTGGNFAPSAIALFTVLADPLTSTSPVIAAINDTVTKMSATLTTLNATIIAINGNVATLSTNVGYTLTNVTALRANLTSISNGLATVSTTLGTVSTSLTSIGATLTSVSGTVNSMSSTVSSISSATSGIATISSTVGTIQTSLSDIGAKVTSLQGNVATIQTDLGTLTGTVSTINNGVATIQTNLGTVQADVSGLKTSVSEIPGQVNVPIYIAIVLALIAAIAAVAGLLLVRRKIAG